MKFYNLLILAFVSETQAIQINDIMDTPINKEFAARKKELSDANESRLIDKW